MRDRKLLIIGAGQYGRVARETAESMNYFEKIDYLDDNVPEAVGKLADMEQLAADYTYAFVAIGNAKLRMELLKSLEASGYTLASLIHPTAYVSPSASIMKGCMVEPKAVIQAGSTLGIGTFASAGSIINHDCFIGDVCHIDVGGVVKSNSVIPMGVKVEAGSVYAKGKPITGAPVCNENEAWVQEYKRENGVEPGFF